MNTMTDVYVVFGVNPDEVWVLGTYTKLGDAQQEFKKAQDELFKVLADNHTEFSISVMDSENFGILTSGGQEYIYALKKSKIDLIN